LKRNLPRLLKLHRLLRRGGVTTDKIQWFVNIARIGAYKIRDPEGVCKAERQLEVIDNKKLVSKHELEDINNRTAYLRIIMSQLSTTCNDKGNEIAYLQNEIQQLEGYLSELKSNSQQFKILFISFFSIFYYCQKSIRTVMKEIQRVPQYSSW
jgi:chromosome segregation ATPase